MATGVTDFEVRVEQAQRRRRSFRDDLTLDQVDQTWNETSLMYLSSNVAESAKNGSGEAFKSSGSTFPSLSALKSLFKALLFFNILFPKISRLTLLITFAVGIIPCQLSDKP